MTKPSWLESVPLDELDHLHHCVVSELSRLLPAEIGADEYVDYLVELEEALRIAYENTVCSAEGTNEPI